MGRIILHLKFNAFIIFQVMKFACTFNKRKKNCFQLVKILIFVLEYSIIYILCIIKIASVDVNGMTS